MSRVVLLVGGVGRMEALYRDAVESLGFELLYAEKRLPTTAPLVCAVLIFVSVCSHPLREAAERIALSQGVPLTYLRKPSVSMPRKALAEEVPRVEA